MPLELSRIHALCFDVDGTLRDTDDQYVATFAKLFRPFRFILPRRDAADFARKFVMTVEAPANWAISIPDRLHLDDELAKLGEWVDKRRASARPHNYLLIPGILDLLRDLSARYPLAVVSARPRRGTMGFLEHFDLTPHFRAIATGQTAPRTKPFPDPIHWAAMQMGVRPENCLMIGDTTVDIRAGKAAGAQTVGVLCGFGERTELERAGADLILEGTWELGKVISNE
ncbi:MAG: HAD family hydrolase [Anaerolineales bacterium]|nr:HAD family hydrolase [Anaerolineales bacterium]